ncbi:MAG: DUF2878 domain-containing protein [Dokdonella sp.]
MNNLLNFAGFQLVWFASVLGAARGMWWLGPICVVVFASLQLLASPVRRNDMLLIALAIAAGGVWDSLMASTELLRYAAPIPSSQLAPVWILGLWANLALTLNHSLRWLRPHPWRAALFGAIGAPLSYLGGMRLGALAIAEPVAITLTVLALGWFVLTPLLTQCARLLDVHSTLKLRSATGQLP